MWGWLIAGYAVLGAVLICCAAFVALFVSDDEKRRETAYQVLKLALATASGGAVVLMIKLHFGGFW